MGIQASWIESVPPLSVLLRCFLSGRPLRFDGGSSAPEKRRAQNSDVWNWYFGSCLQRIEQRGSLSSHISCRGGVLACLPWPAMVVELGLDYGPCLGSA